MFPFFQLAAVLRETPYLTPGTGTFAPPAGAFGAGLLGAKKPTRHALQPRDEALAAQRATAALVTAKLLSLLNAQALGGELVPVAHLLEHRGDADETVILAPQGRQAAQLRLHEESDRLGTPCQVGEPLGQQARSSPGQRGGRAWPRSRLSLAPRSPPSLRHRAPCDTVSQRQPWEVQA